MRPHWHILIALLILTCLACGNNNPGAASESEKKLPPAPAVNPAPAAKYDRITFETDDGVKIVGDYYPAPAGARAPAVLALHMFGGDRATYRQLAARLQQASIAVLAIDGRGFGESTESKQGKIGPTPLIQPDVVAAIKFLRAQSTVDGARIGIIGASYGSSNAIIYAAEDPQIRAVALLSPGVNYFDKLPALPAVKKYGARPLLIVEGEKDQRSDPQDARVLDQAAGGPHQLEMINTEEHGTNIFDKEPKVYSIVESFFVKYLKQ